MPPLLHRRKDVSVAHSTTPGQTGSRYSGMVKAGADAVRRTNDEDRRKAVPSLVKRGVLAIGGLLLAAAVYTSFLIVERQNALDQVSRYNLAWLASQATTELARLQERGRAFMLPGSGVGQQEVQLRLDIMKNRLNLLQSGAAGAVFSQRAELRETTAALGRALDQAQTEVDHLDRRGAAEAMLKALAPIGPPLSDMAATANRLGGDMVAADQRELIRLYWMFAFLLTSRAHLPKGERPAVLMPSTR